MDTESIREQCIFVLEHRALGKEALAAKFPLLADTYPVLFHAALTDPAVSEFRGTLDYILVLMRGVQQGSVSLNAASKDFGQKMADTFVAPHVKDTTTSKKKVRT